MSSHPLQRQIDGSPRQSLQRRQLAQLHGESASPRAGVAMLASTASAPVQRRRVSDRTILGSINSNDYPQSVQHIRDAIRGGHASRVTVDRSGVSKNRRDSLKNIPTISGMDRDEYPLAMFSEGGTGASVRHINPSDNRGAGSSIGHILRDVAPDGEVIEVGCLDQPDGPTVIQF